METRIWKATEPAEVAERLIGEVSDFHAHSLATIFYVFVDPYPQGAKGCRILASTAKLPKVQAAIIKGLSDDRDSFEATPGVVFVIRFDPDAWEVMQPTEREALVHHELCHIDAVDMAIRPHTVEEHAATYRRYGAWQPALRLFGQIAALRETTDGL